MEAISDRIVIKPISTTTTLPDATPVIGEVVSVGEGVEAEGLSVTPGMKVAYHRGNHPEQGEYIIIREQQLLAQIL